MWIVGEAVRPHGYSAYCHDRCRCDICREGARLAEARKRAARGEVPRLMIDDIIDTIGEVLHGGMRRMG